MKRRWKGLCALWMVLVLVIGAVPVTGAAEDVPESAATAVNEAAEADGGQALAESGMVESSSKKDTEIDSSQTENTESSMETGTESSAEDGTEKAPEQSGESEETGKETERTGEETGESTEESDGTAAKSSEVVSEEEESGSEKSEESSSAEETSPEEGSQEEIPSEESSLEESSQEEIETTDSTLTASELLESVALSAKAAAAGEAAVSGDGWLYVGSNEVSEGDIINRDSDMSEITINFDEPFNSQSELNGIMAPEGKMLSGWRLWGFNESGMVGNSPLNELEITGQISAEDYQNFLIDNSYFFLLIVPLWSDVQITDDDPPEITDGGSLVMNVGDKCKLPEGTWQVDGDTTIYTVGTGGRTVYAAKSETFIFHKTE